MVFSKRKKFNLNHKQKEISIFNVDNNTYINLPLPDILDTSGDNQSVEIEFNYGSHKFAENAPITVSDKVTTSEFKNIVLVGSNSKIYDKEGRLVKTITSDFGLPLIIYKKGNTNNTTFINNLEIHTNFHPHGLNVDPWVDGASAANEFGHGTLVGKTLKLQYPIYNNSMFSVWHPHPMFSTSPLLYGNLVMPYIVRDWTSDLLDPYFTIGDNDLPLVFSSIDLDKEGYLNSSRLYGNFCGRINIPVSKEVLNDYPYMSYQPIEGSDTTISICTAYSRWQGTFLQINGQIIDTYTENKYCKNYEPYGIGCGSELLCSTESCTNKYKQILTHTLSTNLLRLRLAHGGCTLRRNYFGFIDSNNNFLEFWVIGSGGGFNMPWITKMVSLASVNRMDIVIDLTRHTEIHLVAFDFDISELLTTLPIQPYLLDDPDPKYNLDFFKRFSLYTGCLVEDDNPKSLRYSIFNNEACLKTFLELLNRIRPENKQVTSIPYIKAIRFIYKPNTTDPNPTNVGDSLITKSLNLKGKTITTTTTTTTTTTVTTTTTTTTNNNCSNPLCKCSDCKCGSNCRCGMDSTPVNNNCSNPLCKCSDCKCGSNCRCGMDSTPVNNNCSNPLCKCSDCKCGSNCRCGMDSNSTNMPSSLTSTNMSNSLNSTNIPNSLNSTNIPNNLNSNPQNLPITTLIKTITDIVDKPNLYYFNYPGNILFTRNIAFFTPMQVIADSWINEYDIPSQKFKFEDNDKYSNTAMVANTHLTINEVDSDNNILKTYPITYPVTDTPLNIIELTNIINRKFIENNIKLRYSWYKKLVNINKLVDIKSVYIKLENYSNSIRYQLVGNNNIMQFMGIEYRHWSISMPELGSCPYCPNEPRQIQIELLPDTYGSSKGNDLVSLETNPMMKTMGTVTLTIPPNSYNEGNPFKVMNDNIMMFSVKQDSSERWIFYNADMSFFDQHPFHFHLTTAYMDHNHSSYKNRIDIISNIDNIDKHDGQDNFSIAAGTHAGFTLKFSNFNSTDGEISHLGYMFHCHYMQHHDYNMMGQFYVEK